MRILAVLGAALVFAACASASITSGEALKAVGNEFSTVGPLYTDACVKKSLSMKQCDDFRSFGEKFKQTYPMAMALWNAGVAAGDKAAQKNAAATVQSLADDLAPLASAVYALYGRKQ